MQVVQKWVKENVWAGTSKTGFCAFMNLEVVTSTVHTVCVDQCRGRIHCLCLLCLRGAAINPQVRPL